MRTNVLFMTILATLVTAGCSGGGAGVGEACSLKDASLADEPVAIELDNSSCASNACLSFTGQQYCTRTCSSLNDCPENMMCMPMVPIAEGNYCVIYKTGTDVEPSYPERGSARYHADEALAAARAEWAADAYVFTIMGSGIGPSGLMDAEGEWAYEFLAPSRPDKKIQLDVTTEGVDTSFISERDYDPDWEPDPMDLITSGKWLFDSHDLIELAEQFGSGVFLAAYPDARAHFYIAPGIIMNQPVAIWNYGLVDAESKSWMFNAETGEKLF